MKLNKNEKSTILDGSLQDEFKAVEKFLSKLRACVHKKKVV